MESRPAFCIFSDDIREEIGGKFSLMGIYGTDLIAGGPFPHVVPKFCITVSMISNIDDPPESLQVRVTYPRETVLFENDFSDPIIAPAASDGGVKFILSTRVLFSPLVLTEPGDLEVFVTTERETARAGLLKVRAGTP